jgi:hypothetical protein
MELALFPIESSVNERKSFVLFLCPFCGSFLHQGLQGFLFLLFSTVVRFAHHCYSFFAASLGGSAKKIASTALGQHQISRK